MTADSIQTLRFDEADHSVQCSFDKSSTESCCRCSRCWMMVSLQHTQSCNATFSIRSRQFSGLKRKRPLVCHHPSWWFMLSCLPQSRSAPCLISLSASGPLSFLLLPWPVIFVHSVFTLLSCVIASWLTFIFFLFISSFCETHSCILQFKIRAEDKLNLTT